MWTLPSGSIVEARIVGQLNGQLTINSFHYVPVATFADGGAEMATMLAFFNTTILPSFIAGQSSDWQAIVTHMQAIYPIRYVPAIYAGTPYAGQLGGVATPSGVAVVVRRKSDLASRKGRGRVYLPGIPNTSVSGSQVTNTWFTTYGPNLVGAMTAGIINSDATVSVPVIWSHKRPGFTENVTTAQVDRILRYQRRREIGVGK